MNVLAQSFVFAQSLADSGGISGGLGINAQTKTVLVIQ